MSFANRVQPRPARPRLTQTTPTETTPTETRPTETRPTGHSSTRTRLRRLMTVGGSVVATVILGGGTAFAHVSVSPTTTEPGSYTELTFTVPTESDIASTTTVEIQLPADTPFPYVGAKQAPGWTIDVRSTPLAAPVTQGDFVVDKTVTSVVFAAADGVGVPPGQFATFDLMVGPVPDVPSISFVAVQTYSDGSVVRWDQPTPADGSEPEYPAPVLTISGEAAEGHDHGAETPTGTSAATASETPVEGSAATEPTAAATVTVTAGQAADTSGVSTDTPARLLGGAGLLLGAIGVGIAIGATRRRGHPAPKS